MTMRFPQPEPDQEQRDWYWAMSRQQRTEAVVGAFLAQRNAALTETPGETRAREVSSPDAGPVRRAWSVAPEPRAPRRRRGQR